MDVTPEMIEVVQQWALNVAIAIGILVVGRILAGVVRSLVGRALRRSQLEGDLAGFLGNLLYYLVLVMAVSAAIHRVGVENASLVAVLGAAGFAVGFALQGSLANFAAGVMLLVFKPFKSGDFIDAAGVSGSVLEIGIFSTVLATPDNVKVIVPNSKLTADSISNYSGFERRRLDLTIGIGYDSPIDKARAIMLKLIRDDERILPDPEPLLAVANLGESSVDFAVRVWVDSADYWSVRFDLTERIKKEFDAQGIDIPFPQRVVHQISA